MTKGKGSSPTRERIKEKQEKVYNNDRSKIAPRVGSRTGRPRTPTHPKKAIKGSAGVTISAPEEEDTPKHKPAESKVDLNEDDPLPIGNQRRKNQEDQSEGDSRKQVSRPDPSLRSITVSSKRKEGSANSLIEKSRLTKEAFQATTNATLMTRTGEACAAQTSSYQLPPVCVSFH